MRAAVYLSVLMAAGVSTHGGAQAISTLGVERDMPAVRSWRITYENDFFAATDRDYTQGIHVEVVHPALAKNPVGRVLLRSADFASRVGLAYEDDGYTGSDLKSARVLPGDRPYAGTKMIRSFSVATSPALALRVSSSLTLGIVGQGAGGKEIQTFIHKRTGNTIPQGWGNQIRNDVIVNYEAAVERRLIPPRKHLLMTGTASARVGTYHTAASMAATLLVGRARDPFTSALRPSLGREWYVYAKPQFGVIGYNATLQGGLFNRTSPYTISAADLARVVYRHQIGLVYRSSSRFIEYSRSFAGPEFRGARPHQSGGLSFGVIRPL
jgi:lipid A 3-O-deacylase